jgi:hypothetical protein
MDLYEGRRCLQCNGEEKLDTHFIAIPLPQHCSRRCYPVIRFTHLPQEAAIAPRRTVGMCSTNFDSLLKGI